MARHEGPVQGRLVDDTAARHVQDAHTLLAAAQLVGADQVARRVAERQVQGNKVGALIDGADGNRSHAEASGHLLGQHRVVTDHVHAEGAGPRRHLAADLSQTQDAERLAAQLDPEDLAPIPAPGPHRAVRSRDLPRQGQEERQGVFGRGDRVLAGRVHHHDATLGGRGHVHVVNTRPGPSHDTQLGSLAHHLIGDTRIRAHHDPLDVGDRLQKIVAGNPGAVVGLDPGPPQDVRAHRQDRVGDEDLHAAISFRTSSMAASRSRICSTV